MTTLSDPPEIPDLTYTSRLGRGGFSEVFLYQSHRPRRQVAVKVLTTDALSDGAHALLHQEADVMAELSDHEFIVSIYSVGTTNAGLPYLVMQYCPPPDLGALVAKQPMDVATAVRTGIQIASAVESAHRAGILHRDIKPANVLRTRDKRPALTDFGIAGRADEKPDEDVGVSIPWTAPEVLAGTSNGSIASDVYSLGATLHHLLTGHSPFEVTGPDPAHRQLVQAIFTRPAPRTGRADIPPDLERLLQECLAKSPTDRPATALTLAERLHRVQEQLHHPLTEINILDIGPAAPGTNPPEVTGPMSQASAAVTSVRRPQTVASRQGSRPRANTPQPAPVAGTVRRPTAALADPEPPPQAQPTSRWAWILAAVAGVAAAATGIAVLLSGSNSHAPRTTTDPVAGSAITPDSPIDGVPSAQMTALRIQRSDAGHVLATWALQGKPSPGDQFVYQVPGLGPKPVPVQGRHVVIAAPRGHEICIEAWLQIAATNAKAPDPPLRACGGA